MSYKLLFKLNFFLYLYLVHSQIHIIQPSSLAKNFISSSIKGSTAAFGVPYYGERLIGKLYYGTSEPKGHCTKSSYEISQPDNEISVYPRIVLVERGECHFVTKVQVAQEDKDAAAVIVINYKSQSFFDRSRFSVIMADDGWGYNIRIPSILINYEDGTKLLEALENKETVILDLHWDIPRERIVDMDCWMSPGILSSITFLEDFAPYAKQLQHKLNFQFHYWIFSLSDDFNNYCIDHGTYCGMPPDWNITYISGKNVVEESLRQHCLWDITRSKEENLFEYSETWWNYIEQFRSRCYNEEQADVTKVKYLENCSLELMESLGIDLKQLINCIDNERDNILKIHLNNRAWSPTGIIVNNARLSGSLDALAVSKAICAGFVKEPDVCQTFRKSSAIDINRDNSLISYFVDTKRTSWYFILVTIIGSLILCFTVVWIYRNWLVKRLRNQLRYEVFEEVKSQISDLQTTNVTTL